MHSENEASIMQNQQNKWTYRLEYRPNEHAFNIWMRVESIFV